MEKRASVLIIISALIIMLNVFLFFKITGYSSQSAQGSVSLIIEGGAVPCGNGTCDSGETCSSCPADCGSCPVAPAAPSGGGGGISTLKDFSVDQALIKVMVRQGESFKTSITIKNTEGTSQNFKLALSPNLKDMVFLSEEEFSLGSGDKKTIYLTFVSLTGSAPDVYAGNLQITAERTKTIPIIFEVKSMIVLFDISLDIPAKYKQIAPGEQLFLQLTLFNLGEIGKRDVLIEYIIKDFYGNEILRQNETVAVETQVSFSRMITLPKDILPGDYVVAAQAKYGTSVGSSSAIFTVLELEKPLPAFFRNYKYFILIAGFIILAFIIIVFLEYERKKQTEMINQRLELIKRREDERRKQAEVMNKRLESMKRREYERKRQAELIKRREDERRKQAELIKRREDERRKQAEVMNKRLESMKRREYERKRQAELMNKRLELMKKRESDRRKQAEMTKKKRRHESKKTKDVVLFKYSYRYPKGI